MAYYGSNYPSQQYGGGYGGGYGGYPTGHSGPPPPSYGGGGYNAYQSNAYGAYPAPQANYYRQPGYGSSGAVAGFTAPAIQQCQQSYQQYGGNAPRPMQPPQSMQYQMAQNAMSNSAMQNYQWNLYQQMGLVQQQPRKNPADSDYDPEEERKAAKAQAEEVQRKLESDGDLKSKLRQIFKDELVRRQQVSGTFELTSGTIHSLGVYPSEDPVNKWYQANRDSDLTDKKWDCEADCEYLRDAMKGLGTNEDAIICVVATRSNSQRQQMKKMFKTMYGRDLIEDIKSELSGDFRETVMGLFVPPAVYDAWAIKEAIYGLGTDEETLVEILMTRTNAQIQEIRKVYPEVVSPKRKVPDGVLEKDIQDDCSGDFKKLLISASQGNRYVIDGDQLDAGIEELEVDGKGTGMYQVNYTKLVDMDKCKKDAERLFKAGEDKWGTDEETFNLIFSTRDYYSLRAIWDQYVKITQRDILNSIDRETSGDFKSGLRAIVQNIRCRPMYFAERLKKSMKGLGTDDKTLIRVIITRSEIDMVQIKQCFLELTGKTLWKWIGEDCSGDYNKLLQAIVGRD